MEKVVLAVKAGLYTAKEVKAMIEALEKALSKGNIKERKSA